MISAGSVEPLSGCLGADTGRGMTLGLERGLTLVRPRFGARPSVENVASSASSNSPMSAGIVSAWDSGGDLSLIRGCLTGRDLLRRFSRKRGEQYGCLLQRGGDDFALFALTC